MRYTVFFSTIPFAFWCTYQKRKYNLFVDRTRLLSIRSLLYLNTFRYGHLFSTQSRTIRGHSKTLWEREKMLETSIFSLSHNVLYPFQNKFLIFKLHLFCLLLLQIWISLTLSKQALVFTCLRYKSFENTVGKEKLLVTSNFSFSHSIFYP